MTPSAVLELSKNKIKDNWRLAFLSAFFIGLFVHMPILLSDIPNHDGLDSLYFDQNMITSGRWFLMIACGFSSFYNVPWVIGLLGLLFLGATSATVTELLDVKEKWAVVAISGLLVAFPALASTFAYVYTFDGYMLALFLAVLSVLLTKKYKYGFLPGGVCLAFSMGVYQIYLSVAMILSLFACLEHLATETRIRDKVRKCLFYPCMGVVGAELYFILLKILLWIQGKDLASYQGINGLSEGTGQQLDWGSRIASLYRDFAAFTLKGNVMWNNSISAILIALLFLSAMIVFIEMAIKRKWWKNPGIFAIIVGAVFLFPAVTNVILIISPSVNYHLLMRYQWVLYLVGPVAFVSKSRKDTVVLKVAEWVTFGTVFGMIFFYGLTDNIAYTNLEKKYEKTYAYCVRLLDRIEQTEGYYQGIPIAMIGVVGEEQFPPTDYTQSVTAGMTGMYGDMLLYTGPNYQKFIQNYLGASLNILPAEAMAEMYYDEEYVDMDSFPGENSIRIIDGILYIKTENTTRE